MVFVMKDSIFVTKHQVFLLNHLKKQLILIFSNILKIFLSKTWYLSLQKTKQKSSTFYNNAVAAKCAVFKKTNWNVFFFKDAKT